MASKGVEKLKRVMWRLEENHKNKKYITKKDVELEIIKECGIDPRTIKNNLNVLKKLKWIKCNKKMYYLGGEDYD